MSCAGGWLHRQCWRRDSKGELPRAGGEGEAVFYCAQGLPVACAGEHVGVVRVRREARRLDKEIFVHHIFSKPEQLDELAAMGNAGLSYNYKDLSTVPDGLVERVHAKGVKMCLRAGDTPEAVEKMVALGLDYIPTNVTVPMPK